MKKVNLVRLVILAGSVFLQVSALSLQSRGAAGDVDLSFDPGSGVNGQVTTLVQQSDGKVLIGGWFTTVKGLARHGIARLNADGSGDSSFAAGFNTAFYGPPTVLALQPDGKVLVGHMGGMHRLHSDGSLDNTFSISVGALDELVYSIALQPDGKILVGGHFTVVNGTNRAGVARLHANGTLDTTFNFGAMSATISVLALQSDGKVVLAGAISLNQTNFHRIVRVNADGTLDGSFNPGDGPDDWVAALAVQSDGKIVIGGHFTKIDGTNSHGIGRLNANGSRDSSFNPGATLTGNYLTYHGVNALAVQADGRVIVGGSFAFDYPNWINVARFNTDGTLDNGFNPGSGAQSATSQSEVFAVGLQPDGKVLIGGEFNVVQGTNRNHIARLDGTGSLDVSFNPGAQIDAQVNALLPEADGKLLIGGAFNTVQEIARSSLARLDTNGFLDTAFIPALAPFSTVRTMAKQPDGKLLLTGFLRIQNGPASPLSIARLNGDGSWDSSFQPDLTPFIQPGDCLPDYGCLQSVTATSVLPQPDGKVLVGGHAYTFVYADGFSYEVVRPFLARFNSNGSHDGSFTSGTNYSESRLVLQPDGKILVGGSEGISRLNSNGTLDAAFNAGAVLSIRSIVLQPDGKVVIGGGFSAVQGTSRNQIARLNANGTLDAGFTPDAGSGASVISLALQPDGDVLVGRDYNYDGTNFNTIARLNADGSTDFGFKAGSGADGTVHVITLQRDGSILIAGNFTRVKGVVRPNVARLYGEASPALSFARSNGLLTLSWPLSAGNFQLQETTNLALPSFWSPVAQPAATNANQITVTVPTTTARKFFQLKAQ